MGTGSLFQEVELPEQKLNGDGVLFPAVLTPTTNTDFNVFEETIRAHRPWLQSLLKERGVILFRGFPVNSPSDFNDVVEAFGFPEAFYVGGRAPRTHIVGRVYTANENPPERRIPFHHEMVYAPDFPTKLFFYCDEAPLSGGETPIVMSNIIYEKMKEKHPDFVSKLEEYGVKYIKVMKEEDDFKSSFTGRSWKSSYMTDDKKVAHERAEKLGSKLEWVGNDAKVITGPMDAIKSDKKSQHKFWFNNLTGPMNDKGKIHDKYAFAEIGNGEIVPDEAMIDCMRILEEESVVIPWEKGDFMLIDNLTVLHARLPLIKPPRRILASLCK